MARISIIVPVYNVEKYLHHCINSILAQTFTDFELILVDDGSTDSSLEICKEHASSDNRIHLFHQENQGQSAARNYALDWIEGNSASQWIAFIDSDDWVHPNYLALLLQTAESTHSSVCVCGIKKTESESEIMIYTDSHSSRTSSGHDFVKDQLMHNKAGVWVLWDKLWKRELWKNTRLPVGRIYEDNATVYKLLYDAERVAEIDQVLYYYFQNPNSTMHEEFSLRKLDWPLVLKEMALFFHEHNETELERISLHRCIRVLIDYYNPVINLQEYRIARDIKRELKQVSRKLKKSEEISITSDPKLYSVIHPLYSRLYWKVAAVIKRVRGKI